MTGESNLAALLRGMQPELHEEPYGFTTIPAGAAVPFDSAFAVVREAEGDTVVATSASLEAAGLAPGPVLARISLTIHSDLQAVGLTAAISRALAQAGISANVVAGYYHDHVFVNWPRRFDAMAILRRLSKAAPDV